MASRYFAAAATLRRYPRAAQHRHITITSDDSAASQDPTLTLLTHTTKQVSDLIRTQPNWKKSLFSHFPSFNLCDPTFFPHFHKLQKNPFLTLRLVTWLASHCPCYVPDESSCGSLFHDLLEANAAKSAKRLLKSVSFSPKVESLEPYVRCLCDKGFLNDGIKVFDEMREGGFVPVLETWNSVLRASAKAYRADLVWKFYGEMKVCGVTSDFITCEYLIRAFCSEKKYLEAFALVKEVLGNGFVPSSLTFYVLVSGLCERKKYNDVSALLHLMLRKNVQPDISIYREIIKRLCKDDYRLEGYRIFNDLKDRGYPPDMVMYNIVIQSLCEMKRTGEARKLWAEMVNKGMPPNEYTYNVLICGFSKIGDFEGVKTVREEMCSRGYKESTMSYNAMINGLCLEGRIMEARGLFKEMREKGIFRDTMTYDFLINGLCVEGKVKESRKLLNKLLVEGLHPLSVSYTVIIKNLCVKRNIHEAKELLTDMKNRGLGRTICTRKFIRDLVKKGYLRKQMNWLGSSQCLKRRASRSLEDQVLKICLKTEKA